MVCWLSFICLVKIPCPSFHTNPGLELINNEATCFVVSKALLNVGEVEKAADPAATQPPQGEAAGTCGCNKSCNCTKAPLVFSDLYSTGTQVIASIHAGVRQDADSADFGTITQIVIFLIHVCFFLFKEHLTVCSRKADLQSPLKIYLSSQYYSKTNIN